MGKTCIDLMKCMIVENVFIKLCERHDELFILKNLHVSLHRVIYESFCDKYINFEAEGSS